jgi:hypothetical protein
MKFNKESKIVRISAFAEGYYSGATAYGEMYIPYEFYLKNKEKLADLECYVGELDGKHSEVGCDIEFEEMTIYEHLISSTTDYNEYDNNIDETLYYRLCDIFGIDDEQGKILSDFSNKIECLEKINNTEVVEITLTKDIIIESINIEEGTVICFEKNNKKEIKEDWSFEFDWSI